jgi:hypothetical protein
MNPVTSINLKCNRLNIDCPLRYATIPDCSVFSNYENKPFGVMISWNIFNSEEYKEITTLIVDILNDDSNKLALLNLNHYHAFIQFIAKYKLNINCKDLTSVGP